MSSTKNTKATPAKAESTEKKQQGALRKQVRNPSKVGRDIKKNTQEDKQNKAENLTKSGKFLKNTMGNLAEAGKNPGRSRQGLNQGQQ